MWSRTDLNELLHIEHPIIQAPMAGAVTPTLAAALSNAGGLGQLGCGEMSPAELEANVAELRSLTKRPFNVNCVAHEALRQDSRLDAQQKPGRAATRAKLTPT